MKSAKNVSVIIQARLSSQRCPRKMIRAFGDTTLMDLCLKKLCNSSIPNENIWISVYEPELIDICKKYDVNIFHRSEKSAMSEGTPMTEMYEWWNRLPQEYAVLVNACAPFMTTETIEKFYTQYCDSVSDGMFGVTESKNYYWDSNFELITPWPKDQAVMNTKFVDATYAAAHCLYAGKLSKIGEGIWMGDFQKPKDIELFPMDEKEVFDIDYEWEFTYYESLYKAGIR